MRFEEVAERVQGIPFMTPVLGRRVYEHIRSNPPAEVLELGTAHGVSASYIAAALEANGEGHLTTVDHAGAAYDPSPEEVLERAGVAHRVTVVRRHSSYNWFLKEQVEDASDDAARRRGRVVRAGAGAPRPRRALRASRLETPQRGADGRAASPPAPCRAQGLAGAQHVPVGGQRLSPASLPGELSLDCLACL